MRLARLALVCGTFFGTAATTLWLGWPESEVAAKARRQASVERALAQSLSIRRAAELLPLLHLDKPALTAVIERLLHAPLTPGAADDLGRALLVWTGCRPVARTETCLGAAHTYKHQ